VGSSPFGTVSSAVLALVMSVLVLVVAAVALRDGLRDGTAKPATTTALPHRDRRPPGRRERPVRAGMALLASSAGIGILLALGVGAVVALLALALRTTVEG
jgi:hypothetical protein